MKFTTGTYRSMSLMPCCAVSSVVVVTSVGIAASAAREAATRVLMSLHWQVMGGSSQM